MKEQNGYPYYPGEYGINFSAIPERGYQIVRSGSGRSLVYSGDETRMHLYDKYSNKFCLSSEISESGIVRFNIRSQVAMGTSSVKHPDFFAREFIKYSLEEYANRGFTVDAVMAKWTPDMDPYMQFWNEFNRHHNPVTAVKRTWTGKTLKPLGFSMVLVDSIYFDPRKSTIEALFLKDKAERILYTIQSAK